MKKARLAASWICPALLLSLGVVGCAGDTAGASPGSPDAPATETERVQAFLDARGAPSDIRYSFKTSLGQTVDCVDFFATRGVRTLRSRGELVAALPQAPPVVRREGSSMVADRVQPAPAAEGVDENGHARLCPAGTVTQIRISPDDIARSGGLDAYVASRRKHPPARASARAPDEAPPSASNWPCVDGEFDGYAHVMADVVDRTPGIVTAGTQMSIHAPTVPNLEDHSISQVWLFGGTNAIDTSGTCTSDCVQSIEAGWQVDHAVASSTGVYDGVNPYIFIYSTLDGYSSGGIGCWNGDVGSTCPAFVPMTQLPATVVPGARLAYVPPQRAVGSAVPAEMQVLIHEVAGNYWVQLTIAGASYNIGYYPGTNFKQPMATFQVGGEAYDVTNDFTGTGLQMGTGNAPTSGYGWAAYQHDYYADVSAAGGTTVYSGSKSMCASTPQQYATAPYAYDQTGAAALSTWKSHFYYGGTAPTSCAPTTCSARDAACGTIADGCGNTLTCGHCGLIGELCESNRCVRECTGRICPR